MFKRIGLISLMLLGFLVGVSSAVEVTCLNTDEGTFVRGTGAPFEETVPFPGIVGPAILKIYNGADDDSYEKVSSSIISINGTAVTTPDVFNQNVNYVEVEVELVEGENSLAVQLKSKPGGMIVVEIFQEIKADAAALIGPEGGMLHTNSGVILEIPPASLIETKIISVTDIPRETLKIADTIDNSSLMGAADFKPDGLQFVLPVTITIPLQEAKEPGTPLPLYAYDEELGNYTDSGFTCIVAENGTFCSGQVTHFTPFAPGVPGETKFPWPFGDFSCFSNKSNTYLGSCSYFVYKQPTIIDIDIDEFFSTQSYLGPRLPNSKRLNLNPDDLLPVWGLFPSIIPKHTPVFFTSSRLYGSFEESNGVALFDREPVLFIHGYQPENEFGGGEEYWGDFFKLINELEIDQRKFAAFDFQWRTNSRFQDVAEDLYYALQKISARMGNKKVHVVAHSFGGIVVRTLLQKYFSEENVELNASDLVASVTTIGTPHSGIADHTIWGTNKILYGTELPKGQESWVHELAGQISVYQMGEPISWHLNATWFELLEIGETEGEVASKLATVLHEHRLPDYLPIQVAIGLTATYIFYPPPTVADHLLGSGDKLITYEGQRFSPELTVNGNLPLLIGQTAFDSTTGKIQTGAYIVEQLLGLNGEDLEPRDSIYEDEYPNFGDFGYKHSEGTLGSHSYLENVVDCENPETCEHDSFLVVKEWLTQYTSTSTSDPFEPYFNLTFTLLDNRTSPAISLFADAYNFEVSQDGMALENAWYDGEYLFVPFYPLSTYKIQIDIDGYQPEQITYQTSSYIEGDVDNIVVDFTPVVQNFDRDGDGYPDSEDAFPDDPNEWLDTDNDGVGNNSDTFPEDPNESADSDGDGVGDNSDCDNGNPDVYPGANEVCHDNIDNNCNGQIDEGCAINLDYGLVGYYPLNGDAEDYSGNNNHGTEYGTPDWNEGIVGNAFESGGFYDPDYIIVPNSQSLSFIENFSISLWFNIESNLSMDGTNGETTEYGDHAFLCKSGGKLGLTIRAYRKVDGLWYPFIANGRNGSSIPVERIETIDTNGIGLNEWHNVIVNSTDSNISLYLDGNLQDSMPLAEFNLNPLTITEDLHIGIGQFGLNNSIEWYPLFGKLDEVRIYNRSLSEAEIQEIYNLEAPADLNIGLVAYYPFNGNAYDESGNGNDGAVNGAILTEDRFGNVNSAYSFDGVDDYIEKENPTDVLNIDSQSYSISAWIKTPGSKTTDENQVIINRYACGWNCNSPYTPAYYGLLVHNQGNGEVRLRGDGHIEFRAAEDEVDVIDGEWHQVGFVLNRDNSTINFFRDGFLRATVDSTELLDINDSGSPFEIGRIFRQGWGEPSGYFNGCIDDIRIYNRALSQTDINKFYYENRDGPPN